MAAPTVVHAGAFPGQNGKIAFGRLPTIGNTQVFAMNPNGSAPTNLSNNSAIDQQAPSYSADGKLIAVSQADPSGNNSTIWVMNANGSGKHRVSSQPSTGVIRYDLGMGFSPDGKKIVFERLDLTTPANSGIWVVNANGSGETPLTTPASGVADETPTFSPGGTKIAFQRQSDAEDGAGVIMLMNASGGTPTPLTSNISSKDGAPNFSPDGKKIAFMRGDETGTPQQSHIEVVDVSTHAVLDLTTSTTLYDEDPAFSPDGTKIAFSREDKSASPVPPRIYVMDADGHNPHPLTSPVSADDFNPAWQPLPPSDSELALDPTKFSAPSTGTSIARKIGTTVSYTAHQPGTTTFTVQRALPGKKSGTQCVKPPKHTKVPKSQRCTRFAKLAGGFSHKDKLGVNHFHFTGRLKGHKLAPGKYRLVAVPSIFGRKGPASTARFRIVA